MVLMASDLDNTMIYSYKKPLENRVLVEELDGKPLSYMTACSWEGLRELPGNICFVPVTTRSEAQYNRIRLPLKKTPEYALVSNGGMLLRRGVQDVDWYEESLSLTEDAKEEFKIARELMEADTERTLDVRMVDDLFLFTKSGPALYERLTESLDKRRVDVHSHGQKIYVIPTGLNKGNMLRRLRGRLGFPLTLACGDSLFDIPMLLEADAAFFPQSLEAEMNSAFQTKQKEERGLCRKWNMPPEGGILSDWIFHCMAKAEWNFLGPGLEIN